MSHPRPYPLCIFCGEKANSREHAIPAWISRQLGIKAFLHNVIVENLTPRRQPVSFASHRARIFCKECNRHFKHLEDEAIPLLVPMARGRSVVLDEDTQQLLALWAAKTGMALIAATAPELRDFVPIEHRRVVREESLPPNECWVAYLPWGGSLHVMGGDHTIIDHDVSASLEVQAYGAILTFAQLAFKVVGVMDPLPDGYRIQRDLPSVKQFWPKYTPRITWPPPGPPAVDGNMPGIIALSPVGRS